MVWGFPKYDWTGFVLNMTDFFSINMSGFNDFNNESNGIAFKTSFVYCKTATLHKYATLNVSI